MKVALAMYATPQNQPALPHRKWIKIYLLVWYNFRHFNLVNIKQQKKQIRGGFIMHISSAGEWN